jgi:hypothetical protein
MSSAPAGQRGFGAEDSLVAVRGGGESFEEPHAVVPRSTRQIESGSRTYPSSSV